MIQAERRTDRHHPLAGLERPGFAGAQVRQTGRRDFQHRDVRLRIAADDLGLELATIGQLDLDLVGAVDHVMIGQQIPVVRDHEPGTDGLALRPLVAIRGLWSTRHGRPARAEEAPEEFGHLVVFGHLAAAHGRAARAAGGFDAHHRRADAFDQLGEIGQAGDHGRINGLGGRGEGRGRCSHRQGRRHGMAGADRKHDGRCGGGCSGGGHESEST